MYVPDFQDAFDPARGLCFQRSRAYWLGRCSELVYPKEAEEKKADRKVKEARTIERALSPPCWKRWRRRASTEDFERARAEAYAAVNRVAHAEAERIKEDVKDLGFGFDKFQFNSGLSTQCFIAASDTVIVICFRGTEPNRLRDIYDDLMAVPISSPPLPGLVHVGFLNALAQVWRDPDTPSLVWRVGKEVELGKGVLDCVREFRSEQLPQLVWITGHSLGGALATMAAARLVTEGVLSPEGIGGVYTFGQPRVGDQAFADGYEPADRHFRVVHDNDPVTRVPPESLQQAESLVSMFLDENSNQQMKALGISFQYRHVGRIAFLSGTAGLKLDITKWEEFQHRITARLEAPFKAGPFLDRWLPGLSDHRVSRYKEALEDDAGGRGRTRISAESHLGSMLALLGGSCVGLLVGLLTYLPASPVLVPVIGGVAASLALMLGLDDRYFNRVAAIRIAPSAAAGGLLGAYIRAHWVLAPSVLSQLLRIH